MSARTARTAGTGAVLGLMFVTLIIAIVELSSDHRLLDAPFGYVGALYHHFPGWSRVAIFLIPFALIMLLAKIGEIEPVGTRIGHAGLSLLALFAVWQLIPTNAARSTGTLGVETAEVTGVVFTTRRGLTYPDRLVLRRPDGSQQSISLLEGKPFASRLAAGDRVHLEGLRSAYGFLVLRVGKAGA